MTDYIYRVTKVCPADLYSAYQELEGAWGESMGDHRVERTPNYTDGTNLYYVMSGVARAGLLQRAGLGVVERPEYDTEQQIDIALAQTGADNVRIYQADEEGNNNLDPTKIMALVGPGQPEIVSLMGLSPLVSEEL